MDGWSSSFWFAGEWYGARPAPVDTTWFAPNWFAPNWFGPNWFGGFSEVEHGAGSAWRNHWYDYLLRRPEQKVKKKDLEAPVLYREREAFLEADEGIKEKVRQVIAAALAAPAWSEEEDEEEMLLLMVTATLWSQE